jgi:hypothetical protein
MEIKKKDLFEVAQIVNSEGIGYAVQDYMSGEWIENPELAELWDRASDLLDKIDAILKPYYKEW